MIWLALFISVAFVPGWTGATIPTGWAAMSITLPFFLWRKAESSPPTWLGLAFLVYAFSSLAWARQGDDAVWELWQLSVIACAFYLGSSLCDLRKVFIGLGIGLTISSAVAAWQFLSYPDGTPILQGSKNFPAGLFYNSVILGETAALVIVGLYANRLWWLIPGVAPGLLLSQSRGAVIALATTAILTITRSFWIISAVGLASLLLVALTFNITDDQRMTTWQIALQGLTPFGHGAGSFLSVYFEEGGRLLHPEFAHNDFLDLIYQFGLGTLPLWAALVLILENPNAPAWPILICFLTMALFSWPMHSPVPAFIGAISAGHLSRSWALDRNARLDSRHGLLHRPAHS